MLFFKEYYFLNVKHMICKTHDTAYLSLNFKIEVGGYFLMWFFFILGILYFLEWIFVMLIFFNCNDNKLIMMIKLPPEKNKQLEKL